MEAQRDWNAGADAALLQGHGLREVARMVGVTPGAVVA